MMTPLDEMRASLVFMGYCARAEAWQQIGYAPAFDSLERLRA